MREWYSRLNALLADGPVVMVTVLATTGSAPREPGARMLVYRHGVEGSIGGGQLEYGEHAAARALLAQLPLRQTAPAWHREIHRILLGADAGQCCGGAVEILHEVFSVSERTTIAGLGARFVRSVTAGEAPQVQCLSACNQRFTVRDEAWGRFVDDVTAPHHDQIFLYGAGHIARALVRLLTTLPFDVSWVDIADERFPQEPTAQTTRFAVDDPAAFAARTQPQAIHLVMTHSHDLDYAICEALLRRNDIAFLGLIGSKTKSARFKQRYRRSGLVADLNRLICPIGEPRIAGKQPAVIAIAIVAQLLQRGSAADELPLSKQHDLTVGVDRTR
jgi:xanthine dehydrogenase accessory factor